MHIESAHARNPVVDSRFPCSTHFHNRYLILATFVACNVGVKEYESDATETVVRQLLRDAGTNEPVAFFLASGHRLTAPSDAFLARFADHQPPVKSYAASKVSPTGDIVDRNTGKIGAMLQIAKVEKKSDTEFAIEAALTSLPVNSNRFVYTVVQQEGRWMVKTRRPL